MLSRAALRVPVRSAVPACLPAVGASGGPRRQQVRRFNVHEYQALGLFNKFGVKTPAFRVATTPSEAETGAVELAKSKGKKKMDFVIKAQVLAGGRGKGTFKNGFEGGVQTTKSTLEVRAMAAKMLGNVLVTKQTGEIGKPCNKVLITERLYLRHEAYFAILLDRESGGPVMVGSPEGGMDIEAVAAKTPELIYKYPIDIKKGPDAKRVKQLATDMGFDSDASVEQAAKAMTNLYELFIKCDCTLVEINPFAETNEGEVLILDAKLNFDDNAEFRQKDIFAGRDTTQEDAMEVTAEKIGLNYIKLDGSIGCLVNGAGLAMATMDAIKLNGGSPANFLDMGGGATSSMVTEAMKLLQADKEVKAVLVNIFGGIMRCDVIALGLISAASTLGFKKPVVVRLAGTNMEEAKKLIEDSGMRMLTATDLEDAAVKAVRVTQIIEMAQKADLGVSFELPL